MKIRPSASVNRYPEKVLASYIQFLDADASNNASCSSMGFLSRIGNHVYRLMLQGMEKRPGRTYMGTKLETVDTASGKPKVTRHSLTLR